jgi:type IV fimbrial biogenesis protein FimT
MPIHKLRGYTLSELAVSLAIIAVLLGAAVPWFGDMIAENRSITLANRFITSLQLARLEAVKRNQKVTLCRSANGTTCVGDWSDGWMIFADYDGDRLPDSDETLLETVLLEGDARHVLNWRGFRSRNAIQFDAEGFIHNNNGTLLICPRSGNSREARAVIINRMGRARVSSDADHDGIHEDARGRPLRCE